MTEGRTRNGEEEEGSEGVREGEGSESVEGMQGAERGGEVTPSAAGACRASLRAVTRSVGASSLRRDVAEECCTKETERWFVLNTCDATNKEGRRECVVWHLVTAPRLETAEPQRG